MNRLERVFAVFLLACIFESVSSFSIARTNPTPLLLSPLSKWTVSPSRQPFRLSALADDEPTTTKDSTDGGVVELSDDEDDLRESANKGAVASRPMFMSQGEIDPEALNPDFSDAKQTRVHIYIIISILPVLFLIPFMLSRDFIPQDMIPPVEM
ncbi:hypothetical protein ACA910_011294 [Epithemia clementina (nom. ined.)]